MSLECVRSCMARCTFAARVIKMHDNLVQPTVEIDSSVRSRGREFPIKLLSPKHRVMSGVPWWCAPGSLARPLTNPRRLRLPAACIVRALMLLCVQALPTRHRLSADSTSAVVSGISVCASHHPTHAGSDADHCSPVVCVTSSAPEWIIFTSLRRGVRKLLAYGHGKSDQHQHPS